MSEARQSDQAAAGFRARVHRSPVDHWAVPPGWLTLCGRVVAAVIHLRARKLMCARCQVEARRLDLPVPR